MKKQLQCYSDGLSSFRLVPENAYMLKNIVYLQANQITRGHDPTTTFVFIYLYFFLIKASLKKSKCFLKKELSHFYRILYIVLFAGYQILYVCENNKPNRIFLCYLYSIVARKPGPLNR